MLRALATPLAKHPGQIAGTYNQGLLAATWAI